MGIFAIAGVHTKTQVSYSAKKEEFGQSRQRTVSRKGSLSGAGLHTGMACVVSFKPAPVDSGIQFFHGGEQLDYLSTHNLRCTAIGTEKNQIKTVEHLLAALSALGISNIRVDVDGAEIPGFDGSALPFVKHFKELGICEQDKANEVYKVTEPIFCFENNKAISIYPAEALSIAYILDYPHPYLRNQKVDFMITPDIFEKEIAPARTFCTEKEALELKKAGFGLGASHDNTLVIGDHGALNNQLRFEDECARHKVLDIIGDLSLLGFSILGRVVGIRSGHALNGKLVEQISAQRERVRREGQEGSAEFCGGKKQRETMTTKKEKTASFKVPFGTEEIKKILPHRYPFLLVDRIVEMKESTAVGIKNVTINEPFFQGHFPNRPIMPGVLIIEALAQVGGVLMLSRRENLGKLAYFVSINNARFRKTVVPGDQLRLEIEVLKTKSKIGIVKGVAKVDGEEVCSAEFMFALVN
mgnify:CR=1 FL=1